MSFEFGAWGGFTIFIACLSGVALIIGGSVWGSENYSCERKICSITNCQVNYTGYCENVADSFIKCYYMNIDFSLFVNDVYETGSESIHLGNDQLEGLTECNQTYYPGAPYRCYFCGELQDSETKLMTDPLDTVGPTIFISVMGFLTLFFSIAGYACCKYDDYPWCDSNSNNSTPSDNSVPEIIVKPNSILIFMATSNECMVSKEPIPPGEKYLVCALKSDHVLRLSSKGKLDKCPYCSSWFKPHTYINSNNDDTTVTVNEPTIVNDPVEEKIEPQTE